MSTRSALGYIKNGTYRGTYIHFDGDEVGEEATKRVQAEGTVALIMWIENGITGGGYRTVEDTQPYGDRPDEDDPGLFLADDYYAPRKCGLDYYWVLDDEGVISMEDYEQMCGGRVR